MAAVFGVKTDIQKLSLDLEKSTDTFDKIENSTR